MFSLRLRAHQLSDSAHDMVKDLGCDLGGHVDVVKIELKERQEFFDSEMLRYILDPTFPDTRQKGSPPSPRNGNDGWMNMVDVIRAIAEEEKL